MIDEWNLTEVLRGGQFQREGGAAPGFLIASPHLTDPNFRKTVILMLEHHGKGALGMIVNRPTEMRVSSAFQSPSVQWAGDPNEVIWYGGPVMRESCWMLHEPIPLFSHGGALKIADNLMVSSSEDRLREITRNPPKRLRFVRGVAGWGAAQLDEELSSGLWLSAELNPRLLFSEHHDKIWAAAYNSLGIDPAYIAPNHGVH